MKKYMLIECPYSHSISVWEYIDDVREACKYWYVKQAIQKYGVEGAMPIVMNRMGGYHTHKPDAPDVVRIVESETWPTFKVWDIFPVNSQHFRTGWISPDGTTYLCGYENHLDCADMLMRAYYEESSKKRVRSDEFLLEHGWCKCTDKRYFVYPKQLTAAVSKYLLDNNFLQHPTMKTKTMEDLLC